MNWVRRHRPVTSVATGARVGRLRLPGCLMPAAGTSGFGDELVPYIDERRLAALVVKSLAIFEWAGNPAPRLAPVRDAMLNSVGLAGPGLHAWAENDLPKLTRLAVPIVVSIWGRTVEEFAEAAAFVAELPDTVVACELNLSCPNLTGKAIFAHDPEAAARIVKACAQPEKSLWAKLSANTDRIVEVADAVGAAGADAVVLINTMLGMKIDVESGFMALGAGRGGLSGRAIHPIAVRSVADVAIGCPGLPIVGVGGVSSGTDAVELMMAGASAVQVGTANFAEPGALDRIGDELERFCATHGVNDVGDLVGLALPDHRAG